MNKPLVITLGDAAGIGPEIIARAWHEQPAAMANCFVAGDTGAMQRACDLLANQETPVLKVHSLGSIAALAQSPVGCIPVLQVGDALGEVAWGAVSAAAGAFAGRCVLWAADAALRGDVAAMVTAPLHKEALHAAGPEFADFPGHTEILQHRAARFLGMSRAQLPVRMMLANDEMRTVLVSIHVPLRTALELVTLENVLQTILITHKALGDLLQRTPEIAVAGLNPHAGEGGLFGSEEVNVIAPAMEAARQRGCRVTGPVAPDTVFMRARNTPTHKGEFDAVVAMYHDQGLIPVKYLGVDKGVNVTLGLPLVRTSPDHGTAFDIAGKGIADAASLLEAVHMARKLAAGVR
jgi:4-hydroxythreonine-4-phosphate dehydrogenase